MIKDRHAFEASQKLHTAFKLLHAALSAAAATRVTGSGYTLTYCNNLLLLL